MTNFVMFLIIFNSIIFIITLTIVIYTYFKLYHGVRYNSESLEVIKEKRKEIKPKTKNNKIITHSEQKEADKFDEVKKNEGWE